jgi:hypothetical protein
MLFHHLYPAVVAIIKQSYYPVTTCQPVQSRGAAQVQCIVQLHKFSGVVHECGLMGRSCWYSAHGSAMHSSNSEVHNAVYRMQGCGTTTTKAKKTNQPTNHQCCRYRLLTILFIQSLWRTVHLLALRRCEVGCGGDSIRSAEVGFLTLASRRGEADEEPDVVPAGAGALPAGEKKAQIAA